MVEKNVISKLSNDSDLFAACRSGYYCFIAVLSAPILIFGLYCIEGQFQSPKENCDAENRTYTMQMHKEYGYVLLLNFSLFIINCDVYYNY